MRTDFLRRLSADEIASQEIAEFVDLMKGGRQDL
jgi:hypothetical protein